MKITDEFGCIREKCTNSQCENRQSKVLKRLAIWWWKCHENHSLELTSKKIPNKNMIMQGIMKITPRGAVANEQVTVGNPTVAHNIKPLQLP